MCECTRAAGTGTAPVEGVSLPFTIYDQMLAYSACRSYKLAKKIKKHPTASVLSALFQAGEEKRDEKTGGLQEDPT